MSKEMGAGGRFDIFLDSAPSPPYSGVPTDGCSICGKCAKDFFDFFVFWEFWE